MLGINASLNKSTPSASPINDEGVLDQESADRVFAKKSPAQPPGPAYPSRPYFGDTHLHTSQSVDSVMFGNTLGPEEAYRFAQGQEVTSSTGLRAQLSRPLDFLVDQTTPRTSAPCRRSSPATRR